MIYTCYIIGNICHELEVDASCKWVDNGIGLYEFWGSVGHDVRMELEIEINECFLVRGKNKRKIDVPDKYIDDIEDQIRSDFDNE